MKALLMAGLGGLAALAALPARAEPVAPAPTSAWLERQQTAAADEANTAGAARAKPQQRCRVVKEWKVGGTVVQHNRCEGADSAAAAPAKPAQASTQR